MADIKKVFKISGMHCSSCAMDIDGTLEDRDGVKESRTSYAKAETEVKFDPSKIKESAIKKLISSTGYNIIASE